MLCPRVKPTHSFKPQNENKLESPGFIPFYLTMQRTVIYRFSYMGKWLTMKLT